jgi:hypothetical protein
MTPADCSGLTRQVTLIGVWASNDSLRSSSSLSDAIQKMLFSAAKALLLKGDHCDAAEHRVECNHT